jgi:hypothetical protein
MDFKNRPKNAGPQQKLFDNAFAHFKNLEQMDVKQGNGPRVQTDTKIDIVKYVSTVLTAPLTIGSNKEEITLILDSGYPGMAMETDKCGWCSTSDATPLFGASKSSSF